VSDLVAVIAVSGRRDGRVVDAEIPVRSLEDLYEACRSLGPMDLMRISLKGPAGELTLDVGHFIRARVA
jgi:hypothetical protein